MKKSLAVLLFCASCTACTYISPWFRIQPVETACESALEFVSEEAATFAGEDIDVTVDINPKTHTKCKKCHFHCPKY